jgi:hypothetical protein
VDLEQARHVLDQRAEGAPPSQAVANGGSGDAELVCQLVDP